MVHKVFHELAPVNLSSLFSCPHPVALSACAYAELFAFVPMHSVPSDPWAFVPMNLPAWERLPPAPPPTHLDKLLPICQDPALA